jgi:hypothetical protein
VAALINPGGLPYLNHRDQQHSPSSQAMLVMTGNQIISRTALALVKKFNDIVDNSKDLRGFTTK